MSGFTLEVKVDAPREKAFHAFSDVHRAEEMIPAITKVEILSPGPVGAGTRWKETRVIFGKEATEELWISEYHPPERYSVMCDSCGVEYESVFDFVPEGGGTRVKFSQRIKAKSLTAKLMQPLGWLMMGSMKKMLMEDMQAMKRAAEKA